MINVAVTVAPRPAKLPISSSILKTPISGKEIPAAGSSLGLSSKGEAELDGTYDTYEQIPATDAAPQSAQIVLRDGVLIEKGRNPRALRIPSHPLRTTPPRIDRLTRFMDLGTGRSTDSITFAEAGVLSTGSYPLLDHQGQPTEAALLFFCCSSNIPRCLTLAASLL